MPASRLSRYEPYALSALRIVAGFLFSLHGFQKLFGLLGGMGGRGASAEFLSLVWVAGVLETFGGLLILLGLFTRPVAFLLSGEMAVAYFRAHAPQDVWPILNRGELAALYCFLFLYFVFSGAGAWSLDRLVRKRH
ncbi:MAG: DoxX family protein [Bryobacteraceae bacterium]